VTISLVGPKGDAIRTWAFTDAWPVKWTGPTLNAASNQAATETLEIAHTGLRVV
jgi:phage tail-like protein